MDGCTFCCTGDGDSTATHRNDRSIAPGQVVGGGKCWEIITRSFGNGLAKSIMISEDEDDDDINKNIDMTNFSLDKSLSVIGRKKTAKVNKNIKKIISVEETENTFYSKISRMKSQKRKINSPSRTKHHNSMISYDKLISKNIEKNQQNLNNPEEYFEGFFNHIILNQQKDSNIVNDDSIKKRKLYNKELKNDDI